MLIMFLNNLAIIWHLLGDSGDYLAIGESSQRGAKGVIKAPQRRQTGNEELPDGGSK